MPGYVEVTANHPPLPEINFENVIVFVQQKDSTYLEIPKLTCLNIKNNIGIMPGTATIVYNKSTDYNTAQTLTYKPENLTNGTRVIISTSKNVTLFCGQIMKRKDQGQTDEIRFECLDDRLILSAIPVRGCLVRDKSSPTYANVKFASGYRPRVNPSGNWNCIGVEIDEFVWPVFAQTSSLGKSYESPDDAFSTTLVDGELTAWTPRRFLLYLCLLANINQNKTTFIGQVQGIHGEDVKKYWRCLVKNLKWDKESITALKGIDVMLDPSGNKFLDPLDKKMPDMNFAGKMMGLAIKDTLKCAGTHEMVLRNTQTEESSDSPQSSTDNYIQFIPTGWSGMTHGKELVIAGGGDIVNTPNSIYDFQLFEDASVCRPSVLVEGKRPYLETEITYTGATSDKLRQAWTDAEETFFKKLIKGNGTNCYAPKYQGDYDIDNTLVCDGTAGTPDIDSYSQEAVRLARMCCPTVFRGFFVNSRALVTQLYGVDNTYSDELSYPILKSESYSLNQNTRPILPTQMQFITNNLSTSDEISARLITKYPIRIQIWEGSEYRDAQYVNGLKMTSTGIIYIDGLGESVNSQPTCIYSGDLYSSEVEDVAMRNFKMNVAMPMDHRVTGFAEDTDYAEINQEYYDSMGGSPLKYIYSPDSYEETHQINSDPASTQQFAVDDVGNFELTPLNRYLPPGSEKIHAEYAAKRSLQYSKVPPRKSQWVYPSIRLDSKPGEWVYMVKRMDENNLNILQYYFINAPIQSVMWDFEKGVTNIGGSISNIAW